MVWKAHKRKQNDAKTTNDSNCRMSLLDGEEFGKFAEMLVELEEGIRTEIRSMEVPSRSPIRLSHK